MRDYTKLAPTFWTGRTGRALKRRGSDAVIAALYLVSSPHSNMLGLYFQPVLYLAEETGLTIEGASEGLRACVDVGFCGYDEESKTVWVYEMASWQIADALASTDKRCKGIQKDYDALPENPFLGAFFDRYRQAFHLTSRREFVPEQQAENEGASQAPSKPHRSQEQEQEQEQEIPKASPSRPPSPGKVVAMPKNEGRFPDFWTAWPKSERKADRKKCLAKWQRHGWDGEADAIVAHVVTMKATRQWREGFEPAPLTYLNGERWRDGTTVGSDTGDVFAGAR